jgi:HD-GYP domain-containing protein (c-di-GMP phosphodiesterase class II)
MQYSQLATVKHHVHVGVPLPFSVRNNDKTLLLARGQVIESAEQMQALFERGALVDLAEVRAVTTSVRTAAPEKLPEIWNQCMGKVGQTLMNSSSEGFSDALDEVTGPVVELIERDSDLAIFQVLRQNPKASLQYGIDHSIHTAITGFLVAQRLGWDAASTQKVFKAALTMNLGMLEIQGTLALQTTAITAEQRQLIMDHPTKSVEMLKLAGITDTDWLTAVAQHHESADGSGYPTRTRQVSDMAALVRRADIYTAKLSPRLNRDAMAADKAGRTMFMNDPGNPMTAALVKEFGVYPPGCFVKLVSGETAVVLKRGASVITPKVAALTTPSGAVLAEPVPMDTAKREHAIASVLGEKAVNVKISAEKLMQLSLA